MITPITSLAIKCILSLFLYCHFLVIHSANRYSLSSYDVWGPVTVLGIWMVITTGSLFLRYVECREGNRWPTYPYIESTKYCDGEEQGSKAACMVTAKPGGRDPERHPWGRGIDTELWWLKHRWEVNEARSETTLQDMLKSLNFKWMGSLLKDFQHHTSAMSDLQFSNIARTPVYSQGWAGQRIKTKELT